MNQFFYSNKNNSVTLGTSHDFIKGSILAPTRGLADNSNHVATTQWVNSLLGNKNLQPTVYKDEGLRIRVTGGTVQTDTRVATVTETLEPISVISNAVEYVWVRWADSNIVVNTTFPTETEGFAIAEVHSDATQITQIIHYITKLPWAPTLSPYFMGDPKTVTPYVFDYDKTIANTYWTQRHNYHFLFGYDAPYFFYNLDSKLEWTAGTITVGDRTIAVSSGFESWSATDPCLNPTGLEERFPIYLLQTNSGLINPPNTGYVFIHLGGSIPDSILTTLGYLWTKNGKIIGFETPTLVPFLNTSNSTTKYTTNIGDGSSTVFTVNHNLGTQDITFSVKDLTTNIFESPVVETDGANAVTITFSTSMNVAHVFRVTIIG
jgi:hypothetical protein